MKRQSGITLVEILITVLVLAIGLLGIAALQTTAMTGNYTSYQYTQAAFLAQSMVERMRANRNAYASGNSFYNLAAGSTTGPSVPSTCYNQACTPQQQALWDLGIFYSQVTGIAVANVTTFVAKDSSANTIGTLPGGQVSVVCDNPFPIAQPGKCLVSVYWDPGRTGTTSTTKYSCDSTDSTALKCFRLAVILP